MNLSVHRVIIGCASYDRRDSLHRVEHSMFKALQFGCS